jgi:hypothetical protein
MLARVSNLEAFRYWREAEDQTVEDLVERLTTFQPTPAMQAGTAFHKALELAEEGEHETLAADGYTFIMPEGTLVLPPVRELRGFKAYGPLTVTGCVDATTGKRVDDHKTTARFDPERYLAGYPWRLYLDIFDADIFRWNVFEVRETKRLVYEVSSPQTLEAYRYPGLHEDCARLAAEFYEFARVHMPDFNALTEAA